MLPRICLGIHHRHGAGHIWILYAKIKWWIIISQSFNSWILKARGKPILKMLEDIRIKIMNRLREKEDDASKWTTDYSSNCMKLFTAYMRITQLCSVDFNADLGYEVFEGEDRHTVNLVEKKCTYRS
ncbi:hypothetical protein RDI58_027122 [Solanum bulbocastanum]|uniref:Uncharacterized protein n=1 Tax=Solanum bulbocastanum TaxID=147425 RepID=A0AAN8T2U0_SOLBU